MESKGYIRKAFHAGTWYQSDANDLHNTLSGFLQKSADVEEQEIELKSIPRGIIAPHAGYNYSGPTAGYAYNGLVSALKKSWYGTVVVLHPSHHVYLDGCAVSGATSIETPLGNLTVDDALREELLKTGEFSVMDKETDENEHSGEMQYPFIAKAFLDCKVDSSRLRVLPLMIGAISKDKESNLGEVLSKFIAREKVFSVISSDFCHWGKRFGFTPTKPPGHIKAPDSIKEIFQYIEWMDRLGMDYIASQKPGAFAKYIKIYKNTICGKHPISVYLSALNVNRTSSVEEVEVEFVRYAQSSEVRNGRDSSVSYASALITKKCKK